MLILSFAACAPERVAATAIVVSVKTDLALGRELSSLSYRVFRSRADPAVDAPVAEFTAAAQTLAHPFVILQRQEEELLLSVEGFDQTGQDAVLVQQVRARFVAGASLALPVFLARACLGVFCDTAGLTCYGQAYGDTRAGECAAIPGPAPLDRVRFPGDEAAWFPIANESLDAGTEIPPFAAENADGAITTSAAGFR